MRYPVMNLGQVLPSVTVPPGGGSFAPSRCEQIPENRLLDRYNCEREEFIRRFQPQPVSYIPPAPPPPAKPPPTEPGQVREFKPLSDETMKRICDAVKTYNDWENFEGTETGDRRRNDAVADVQSIINSTPPDQRQNVVEQIRAHCPDPAALLDRVRKPTPTTIPYQPPYPPVPTQEGGWPPLRPTPGPARPPVATGGRPVPGPGLPTGEPVPTGRPGPGFIPPPTPTSGGGMPTATWGPGGQTSFYGAQGAVAGQTPSYAPVATRGGGGGIIPLALNLPGAARAAAFPGVTSMGRPVPLVRGLGTRALAGW